MIRLLLYQVCRNDRLSTDFALLVLPQGRYRGSQHIDDRFCEVLRLNTAEGVSLTSYR